MYSILGGAGGKFFLEEGMITHSSILAWSIPMDRGAWWATVHRVTVVKNPPVNAGDIRNMGLIPGSGRSLEGGHGNPLQYSCWKKPHIERGAQQAMVHSVPKSWTWLKWLSAHMHSWTEEQRLERRNNCPRLPAQQFLGSFSFATPFYFPKQFICHKSNVPTGACLAGHQ